MWDVMCCLLQVCSLQALHPRTTPLARWLLLLLLLLLEVTRAIATGMYWHNMRASCHVQTPGDRQLAATLSLYTPPPAATH
jgi:hypothetical protein